MDTKDWIAILIAGVTLINSWAQFWAKERLFNPNIPAGDAMLTPAKD